MTRIHALKVLIDAEGERFGRIVVLQVGLGTLEALDTIVKSCVGGIQLEVLDGSDAWSLPASITFVIVTVQHVVRGQGTEDILVIGTRLGLELISPLNC